MNDSPLSPEAVAQMVTDLRAADKPLIQSGPFIQTRERLRTAADMLTTLVAENAILRAENEELDFLRHEGGPDSVAAMEIELATLQASEAAAVARVKVLEAALEVYEDALTEAEAIFGGEYGDHYGPMCEMAFAARDARLAALTPTSDKEPKT